MDPWLVNLCNAHGAYAEIDYQQARDPEALGYELTANGWCLGMAIQWLIQNSQRSNIWDFDSRGRLRLRPEVTPAIRFIMARQGVICKQFWDDAASQIDKAMLKGGLQPANKVERLNQRYTPVGIFTALKSMTGPYTVLQIYWGGTMQRQTAGHAVAFLRTGSRPSFMDPNFGEFTFDSMDKMLRWFNAFMLRTYPLNGGGQSFCLSSYTKAQA
ncbi:YopT-type cysteine protease domain-containing protein [Acetobacter sp. DsW_063]|uniref:YopT-type cysteine protease domain-containing protein n=1 Tax=Acetobacter sp. DsW_063 TaxID=1514894 RepID=UPI000B646092|nr:YopT-type cysteine protease domain-containing protein [Acetobacter sp. DsW_063]OUJ14530.1 hypothetical protein HK28_12990 [Acetobacter sp. DsW_063]